MSRSPSGPGSGSGPDAAARRVPPSTADRVRLVAVAAAVGLGCGVVGVLGGTIALGLATAADSTFLLGTVAFGFGLLGWAGSVAAGRSIETMQALLETNSGWTEADSRRAMARIGGFGAGVMLAAVAVGTALGYA